MSDVEPALRELFRNADACERSWSIGAHEIEERVLAFYDSSVKAASSIARAARALGIDDVLLADWAYAIRGADALGLALRCDRQSVRLYTQYWTAIVAHVERGDEILLPLYRGFKALPDGTVRCDDYVGLPMAPPKTFWPPMAHSFAAFDLDESMGQDVFADLNAATAIFTVTQGDGRRSWLTTVRRAQIARDKLSDWLEPLGTRPGGQQIIATARENDLVHIAGGTDATKGVFLTLYFESDVRTVMDALGLLSA